MGFFFLLQRLFFVFTMGFGDLKSASGLKVLNGFLADRSYIEGFVPSQADVAVFENISAAPSADLCHALRWFNHIKSYQSQKSSLPGVKKPLGQPPPPPRRKMTMTTSTCSAQTKRKTQRQKE